MNHQDIVKFISTMFPTRWQNATRFGVNQIMMAITLVSISGVNSIRRIALVSDNGFVKALLKLGKANNQEAIPAMLKGQGQNGARELQVVVIVEECRMVARKQVVKHHPG